MLKNKNKFTGQERVGHKPVVCNRCGVGSQKGSPPLKKIKDGKYLHKGGCPMPLPRLIIPKSPDERMA